MRLHSLTLTGVGPFRGRERVDFDAVSASGLFLIEGPTGAGKTTIIDGIVFALYGSLSGAESDSSRMRSQFCDAAEPTEVTLEFSIGGIRHTITRSPAYERRKARGEGTTPQRATQTLMVDDDDTPDMREAREIGAYLIQRIGLTVDQFRRLVVLPQGEFDTLLRAKPRERYDTVAGLIDDGFLERVQEDLKDRADDALRVRRDAVAEVERILGVMRERAAEVIEVPEEFDPEAVVTDVGDRAAAAAAAAALTSAALDTCRAREHDARTHAAAAHAASEARAALDRAQVAAGPEVSGFDDAALQALAHDVVSQRTRLEPLAEWESAAESRAAESARRHALADDLALRIEQARADAALLPGRLAQAEAALSQARLLADRAAPLQAEVERLEALQLLIGERDRAAAAAEVARTRAAAEGEALQGARDAMHAARTAHHVLVRTQLEQRAAHLASLLADGEACPVCGSCDHPRPAHDARGELVSDADVSAAERLAAAAEKDEAIAATVLEEARASLGALDQRLAVVIAQLDGSTVEGVAASLATAQAALGEAQSAAATMATLAQEVEALAAQISTSATVIEGLLADEAAARADARAYDATVAEEADRHREQVGASASAAEALTDLRGRLAVIEDVQRARSAAAGHPVTVDPAAADATLAHAVTARSQAEAEHAAADEQRARLAHAHAALVTQSQELASARDQLDAIGSSTEAAIQLGTLVTARSPANRRNLTLQSYSVQRRFQAVLEASSIHLERMSGGQFSFVIDDKASGRAQAGLGIDIHDAWTGQSRDPESLSGGETFYASLSLALGLADIVREEAGGVSLDTLFVDEGFGSLDADTLSVVLDQLDALRSRGRVVGVISHVAEMKEWVHDRIVVSPGAPGAGSRILQQA